LALVVAAPLYQVSDPLLRQLATVPVIETEGPRVGAQRNVIAQLNQAINTANADWRLRPEVAGLNAQLRAETDRLDGLLLERTEQTTRARLEWRAVVVIAGQILVLILAAVSVALGITMGIRCWPDKRPVPATVSDKEQWPELFIPTVLSHPAPALALRAGRPSNKHGDTRAADTQEEQNKADTLALILKRRIAMWARSGGPKSQSAIATETGLTGKDVSILWNHANNRLKPDSRTHGLVALRRIEHVLNECGVPHTAN